MSAQTSFPGDILQLDLVGPFRPANGFITILPAIDVFTKYMFAIPLRRVTARAIVDALTSLFLRHAYIPQQILTDKGSQFISNLMKEATQLMDIELNHATVAHPQTIGLERSHADLKKTLKIYENENHSNWHRYIDYAVFAHNTSFNPQTGTTPADLFHAYQPHKAIDVRFNIESKKKPQFETTQQLQDYMATLHRRQKTILIADYVRYKKYYDKQAQAKPIAIHSYCLLLNPILANQKQILNKMEPKWLAMYRVEKKFTHENYLIREVGTNHTQIVHRIRLRPYIPNHTVKDLPEIDKSKFKSDLRFDESQKEPAIFDTAREALLWHPGATDVPETDQDNPKPQKRRVQNVPAIVTVIPRRAESPHPKKQEESNGRSCPKSILSNAYKR